MKKKSIVFLCIFLSSLIILPLYHIFLGRDFHSKKFFDNGLHQVYNIDPVLNLLGTLGNFLGISLDTNAVYFGKNGWLYLGEGFNQPISKKISGAKKFNNQINALHSSILNWSSFLKKNNVKNFYIIIGPDKESIYSEFTPSWFKQSSNKIHEKIIQQNEKVYIDSFTALESKKEKSTLPLYFKTDTHWNELGATQAFMALAIKSNDNKDGIDWPPTNLNFEIDHFSPGDLSKFQRSGVFLHDLDVKINNPSVVNLDIVESAYRSGEIIYKGKNISIESPKEPLLIRTPHALNNRRVIWLRDSFGTAMSRLMAATFTETLQIHHGRVSPEEIRNMIIDYQPDYVIVTVVERDSLNGIFAYNP